MVECAAAVQSACFLITFLIGGMRTTGLLQYTHLAKLLWAIGVLKLIHQILDINLQIL